MCLSSPGRTPKLQLAAEQPLTGEHWITQKRDIPSPRAKEKPQQDGGRGEIMFRIKPLTCQRLSEGSNKTCAHQNPEDSTETESDLCLSVSCEGTGQQWPDAGAGALGAADLGHTACSTASSWRRSPLTPP